MCCKERVQGQTIALFLNWKIGTKSAHMIFVRIRWENMKVDIWHWFSECQIILLLAAFSSFCGYRKMHYLKEILGLNLKYQNRINQKVQTSQFAAARDVFHPCTVRTSGSVDQALDHPRSPVLGSPHPGSLDTTFRWLWKDKAKTKGGAFLLRVCPRSSHLLEATLGA